MPKKPTKELIAKKSHGLAVVGLIVLIAGAGCAVGDSGQTSSSTQLDVSKLQLVSAEEAVIFRQTYCGSTLKEFDTAIARFRESEQTVTSSNDAVFSTFRNISMKVDKGLCSVIFATTDPPERSMNAFQKMGEVGFVGQDVAFFTSSGARVVLNIAREDGDGVVYLQLITVPARNG